MKIDVKLIVNGKELPTNNRDEWERVSRLVYTLLDLSEAAEAAVAVATAPQTVIESVPAPVTAPKSEARTESVPDANRQRSVDPLPPSSYVPAPPVPTSYPRAEKPLTQEQTGTIGLFTTEEKAQEPTRIVEAWKAIGRPATGEEIHESLTKLGHRWKSQNPEWSTKRVLRDSKDFLRIGLTEDGKAVWTLRNAPRVPAPFVIRPFTDKKIMNYALEVFEEEQQAMDLYELAEKMMKIGWVSVSPDAVRRVRTLRQTLVDRAKGVIEQRSDGRWGLVAWRSVRPPVSPPLSAAQLNEAESKFLEQRVAQREETSPNRTL